MLGAVAGLASREGVEVDRDGGGRGLLSRLQRDRTSPRLGPLRRPSESRVPANVCAMVVAIDGPAGAGKSTVARAVAGAARLHLPRHRGDVPRRRARRRRARRRPGRAGRGVDIELGDRVLLDGARRHGRDPHARRSPRRASRVSADPAVRAALVRKQRALLARRATGSPRGATSAPSSCPDAEVKVFLTASPEVRARRRAEQIGEDYGDGAGRPGACATGATCEREHSPLVPARRRRAGRHQRRSTSTASSTRS